MLTVGAALGGVVTAVFGRDAAIVIDAVSFVASAVFLLRIHRSFQEARARRSRRACARRRNKRSGTRAATTACSRSSP